jgi:beta-galactosidase
LEKAGIVAEKLHRDIRLRDNNAIRYIFNYGPEAVDCRKIIGTNELEFGEVKLAPRSVAAFRL